MKLASGISTIALLCMPLIAQASEPTCSTGIVAYLEGEINNNAVSFTPSGLPVTLGVAELKIYNDDIDHKLSCALWGNPNITGGPHIYDHLIVCDDEAQSQLSMDTSFVGEDPLDPKLERRLCHGNVQSYFQEESLPDPFAKYDPVGGNKGIFQGVDEGNIFVTGCVNVGSDSDYDYQINMVVDGYVCLMN